MLLACSYTIPAVQSLPGQGGGGGSDTESLILEVNTALNGQTSSNQFKIQIQTFGVTSNYNVNWGDGNTDENVTTDITHTYDSPGVYDIKISEDFAGTRYSFGDAQKITQIKQWGTIQYKRLQDAFRGARNLDITATDIPDLTNLDSQGLQGTFRQCFAMTNSNGSLVNWDTSTVANFNSCFYGCQVFNQPIPQNWDFSNVGDNGISFLFFECYALDQDVSQMNVNWSNITNLTAPFGKAGRNTTPKYNICNYDISNWDVSNVVSLTGWSTGQSQEETSVSDKQPLSIGMDQWDLSGLSNYSPAASANFQLLFCNMRENAGCTWNDIVSGWASYINPTNVDKLNYQSMFRGSTFNEDLSPWDLSNAVRFNGMFERARSYNQPLSGWSLSSIASQSFDFGGSYTSMFRDADSFDQSLGDLNIGAPQSSVWNSMLDALLRNESISTANYDATLIAWNNQINALPSAQRPTGCLVNMGSSTYTLGSAADTARANLISTYSWSFTDGGGV